MVDAVTLIIAVLGAGVGRGGWMVLTGMRRSHRSLSTSTLRIRATSNLRTRSARAGVFALTAGLVTRWPVAAAGAAAVGWWWTELIGTRSAREHEVARTEAIATWTEMLRDTLAGAHGLEQAIRATQPQAPAAIRQEVAALAARIEREPLASALVEFGMDLAHPVGDLVVASLRRAPQGAVSDL
jgi:tight adherence protein B